MSISVATTPLQAQAALGSQGLPVLCDIVKNEQKDIDMLQLALECLVLALSQPVQDSPSQHKQVRCLVVRWCWAAPCQHKRVAQRM